MYYNFGYWLCNDCGAEDSVSETLDNRCCSECGSVDVDFIEDFDDDAEESLDDSYQWCTE